jgi:hypothetical protein
MKGNGKTEQNKAPEFGNQLWENKKLGNGKTIKWKDMV